MDRASLSTLHARATDLLAALLSHADCAVVMGERAIVAACIPFDLLDDAFAVLGALEDLEEQHDREADYATQWGATELGGFADAEPSLGWPNPAFDRQTSWLADGSPLAWDNDQ